MIILPYENYVAKPLHFIFIPAVDRHLLQSCSSGEKTSKTTANLDEHFSQQFRTDEPGGAVLILKGDKILFSKGYGIADITTKEPITNQILFKLLDE